MGIKVFWLEPTTDKRLSLRRWSADGRGPCPSHPSSDPKYSRHQASVVIGDEPDAGLPSGDVHPHDDARWPKQCACGYAFADDDEFFLDRNNLYRRSDTGELTTLRGAPIGAMWDAHWMSSECWRGPDGISLVVKTPGGDWCVDHEASNCTRTQWGPKEIDGKLHNKVWLGRTHYCWVRHGDPRTGNVHVDKSGDTCAAGAGSILIGGYHGFLHNGELVQC
jgi:hypothetical protein